MRRPLWSRALTAVWGLWFALALAEPAGLHSCPMHGNHAAHMAGGAMAGMAGHAMPGDDASHGSQPGHQGDAHKGCTCLGACCCAPAVSAPVAEVALVDVDETLIESNVAPVRAVAAPASAPRYSRPFANGPPAGDAAA